MTCETEEAVEKKYERYAIDRSVARPATGLARWARTQGRTALEILPQYPRSFPDQETSHTDECVQAPTMNDLLVAPAASSGGHGGRLIDRDVVYSHVSYIYIFTYTQLCGSLAN